MAAVETASYPLPPPALFAGNASSQAGATSRTPSQGEESILKKALTKDLPPYLKAGMALPATKEAYEEKYPPIDEGLQGDLKETAKTFYDTARDSALEIQKHTTEFHSGGYQLIFQIPNGINSLASTAELAYNGLKEDLKDRLDNPPEDDADFKYFIRGPKRNFEKLSKIAKEQKEKCVSCIEELNKFKPIIEADKKELESVNTAYEAVAPLMQRDIEAKKKERDDVQKEINKLKAKEAEKAAEMRNDPTGGTAASFTVFGDFRKLDAQIKEKNTQLDALNSKDQKLKEWKTLLADQENSMDGVRNTIDAAITATDTIRVAYEKMESHFTSILDSFVNLEANMMKSDPKFQRKGLGELTEAETQWGEVLKQVKVFMDSKVYQ